MGKPKDAKIWNEDLVKALDARYQKAQREGKSNVHLWRTGRDQILAVRKDIYMYRSGNIVNLPNNLKKTVQRLCEDVIRGVKSVYPDGHVPTNQHQASAGGGNPSTPVSSAARVPESNNPFARDHYMRKMKIRGGAFAILMAFRYSMTEILSKRDIIREAQKFSDEEMEGNYHAGRMYGSWNNIKTLKNRGLVKEQGYATYTPNGFRDRPHTFSLTRDGELFIDALLASRPEAVEAARQAAGRDPRTPFAMGGTPRGVPHHTPLNSLSPILPHSGDPSTKLANMQDDRVKLEEWLKTASEGDRKEFKVGKDRRLRLHKLCDALQRHHPGLVLTHGSSGNGRGRTLSILLVSKPPNFASTPARARATNRVGSEEIQQSAHSESSVLARERAGLAAIKRQEAAMEDIQLKTAILESKKMSSKSNKSKQKNHFHTPNNDGDRDLEKAIQASLRDSRRKTGVKRNIFATIDSSSSDDDLPGPFMSPSPSRKRQRMSSISEEDKKPAAKKTSREIFCIDSESDSEKKDERKMPALPSTKRRKKEAKKIAAKQSRRLSKDAPTPSSINLCESTDDDDEVIEIREKLHDPIDLSSSQLSQDPEFAEENEETIDLSNSQLSQLPDLIDRQGAPSDDDDDDDIIILEDDVSKYISSVATSTARISSNDNSDAMLTVYIDNRERNRNATPRTLRNELTRHLSTGPLRHVWPQSLPIACVEEAKLDWGDIQYSIQRGNSLSQQKLGVSIERKRVNDLVQRSAGGDHFAQLFHMKQHCSLSVLLIENDTRTAQGVTPYNAQDKDVFDPFDTTVRSEDDVYRMFGRILLACDSIKFIQTRDEQGSLRAIGALGLMAIFAPPNSTKYLGDLENGKSTTDSRSAQALSDQLKEGGIPWRMAKRIASVVGSPIELEAMYDSCSSESAKSQLLTHAISLDDQDDLKSSVSGWSDAIYRIVTTSSQSIGNKTKLSGEAALLLHKELIDDHGRYLSILHQGSSPKESLEQVLDTPCVSSSKNQDQGPRYVAIALTAEQATKYFPPCSSIRGEMTFYKLSIISKDQSKRNAGAIAIQTVSEALTSKMLLIFEMEGSKIVDLVCDSQRNDKEKNFVSLAKTIARRIANEYCQQQKRKPTRGASSKRILMVCGLQPALDANAKKSGYSTETKTLIDLIFAELMLCYDVIILQALRKKVDDRVKLVKQLALACYHCAFLTSQTN